MKPIFLLTPLVLVCQLVAGDLPDDVAALQRGQPKEVRLFIERVFLCHHWAGEEPYSQARAKQINEAVQKLRCDQLPSDEARLRKKYKSNPKVLAALDSAKAL
jgi:hypothetical protein